MITTATITRAMTPAETIIRVVSSGGAAVMVVVVVVDDVSGGVY
jgi:hypothetical protein